MVTCCRVIGPNSLGALKRETRLSEIRFAEEPESKNSLARCTLSPTDASTIAVENNVFGEVTWQVKWPVESSFSSTLSAGDVITGIAALACNTGGMKLGELTAGAD